MADNVSCVKNLHFRFRTRYTAKPAEEFPWVGGKFASNNDQVPVGISVFEIGSAFTPRIRLCKSYEADLCADTVWSLSEFQGRELDLAH